MYRLTEDKAREMHNDAPETYGFLGAIVGVALAFFPGVMLGGIGAVVVVFLAAVVFAFIGFRLGLRRGRTWVFVDIPRHREGGIQIRAKNEALREHWPAVVGPEM